MNNEKEIEHMSLLLVNDILLEHTAEETAEHLASCGIGDKKQAVKEFAKKLKKDLFKKCVVILSADNHLEFDMDSKDVFEQIDTTLKEFLRNE